MFFYHLKIALRKLLKFKQSSLLNIIGLIIALTLCFIALFHEMFLNSSNKFHHNAENIYRIKQTSRSSKAISTSFSNEVYEQLNSKTPGIESISRYIRSRDYYLSPAEDKTIHERYFHFVDTNFFDYIVFDMIRGSTERLGLNSLLISDNYAKKLFGTIDCIHKKINVKSYAGIHREFSITGVFKEIPNSTFNWNLVGHLDNHFLFYPRIEKRDHRQKYGGFVVLEEHIAPREIAGKIIEINEQSGLPNYSNVKIEGNYREHYNIELIKITGNRYRKGISTFSLIPFLVLIIAVLNFSILSNAIIIERSKSIGIKKVVGAFNKQLILQTLTESFIICFISALLAFLLSITIIPSIREFLNPNMVITVIPKGLIILYALLLVVITTILNSISTIVIASRLKPVKLLHKTFSHGKNRTSLSSSFIIFQVTIFLVLLIFLFIIKKQISYLESAEWGFDRENLVKAVPARSHGGLNKYQPLKDELIKLPGIQAVSAANYLPPSRTLSYEKYTEQDENGDQQVRTIRKVSGDYNLLTTLKCEFISGRNFDKNKDSKGQGKIIVNERFLSIRNLINPYDTIFSIKPGAKEFVQIIGVIKNFHYRGLSHEVLPMVFYYDNRNIFQMLVRLNSFNVKGTMDLIKETYQKFHPNEEINISFVNEEIDRLYRGIRLMSKILGYTAVLAVLIACMGLFSFMYHTIVQRIKEIGIRKVNGAKQIEIILLLNHKIVIWLVIAFIIASPLGYLLSENWLENFAYKTEISWWVIALAGTIALMIALLTVSWQSWRAARRNPVEALRHE